MNTLINNPIGKRLVVFLFMVPMIATSCASYMKVHLEPINIQSVIEPCDSVKIVTKDNKEIEFVVVEVSDEAIKGEHETVLFTDIARLEEVSVSAGENALVILGISAGAAGAAALSMIGGARIGTPKIIIK